MQYQGLYQWDIKAESMDVRIRKCSALRAAKKGRVVEEAREAGRQKVRATGRASNEVKRASLSTLAGRLCLRRGGRCPGGRGPAETSRCAFRLRPAPRWRVPFVSAAGGEPARSRCRRPERTVEVHGPARLPQRATCCKSTSRCRRRLILQGGLYADCGCLPSERRGLCDGGYTQDAVFE
jgi:hypothetical protein